MDSHDSILSGFTPALKTAYSTDTEIEAKLEDTLDDLHWAKRKLEKAKKKGKGVKKLKKKVKKLKTKSKKLERKLQYAITQTPYRGRWDGLIEKSVPEGLKLINTIVQRMSPRSKRETAYGYNKGQEIRQSSPQPIYLPPSQPVYCLPPPQEEEK